MPMSQSMNGVGALEIGDAGPVPSFAPQSKPQGSTPEVEETPEIVQIVPATGWWVDRPSIDPETGAIINDRGRAIAFALCRFSWGVEVRPVDETGKIAKCSQLQHESDAGLISKYKKRARAKTTDTPEEEPTNGLKPIPKGLTGYQQGGMSERPDELRLKHLKTSLFEGLQWVSAILDKDPGDELLRQCRQQLRWMQSAVENERRPTISELGQVTLTAKIVPELTEDDPYLAQMLTEIEDLYRDL
jgi:hypothetical protein